jgi:peptidyl-dipeptidase Dcp
MTRAAVSATADNPLLLSWETPFGLPPFERIRPEHFPPAFDRAMAEHEAEIAAITAAPEPSDFGNTIEALERSGRTLTRVGRVFDNLTSSATNEALDAIDRDYAPRRAAHHTRILLDGRLFARVDALYRARDMFRLTPEQNRLLERYHLRFVRAGALLDPEQKARMAAITERLASLHTLFGQNVLHDEDNWRLVLEAGDLEGMPEFARAAAATAAADRGLDGKYVITLARASAEPFLAFSARRDLRRTAYEAWAARGAHPGAHDNRPLIAEIIELRAEQARLLGYETYADYRLDDSMARTPQAARALLEEVWEPARRKAAAERAELSEAALRDGVNEPIAPWDWRYYAEKVRQRKYAIDEAELKPFFMLDNMVQAAFDTAGRLFGIGFVERRDCAPYHPDVRAWEVRDNATGRAIGLFLHDNFARPGKHSGAWMSSYRVQEALDGEVLPVVVNNNNFSKGEPTLLSFDDARTLFHEFGHALHGLLSRVRYPSQSGTAVRRDFVEFPSQVFEHWLDVPENLRRYARHAVTGEPLSEALLLRLLAARNFNQGFATVEYTACALLDLDLHARSGLAGIDIEAFERDFLAKIGMPAEIGLRHRPAHFQHLFAGGGYAAGYYAYMWAEVLDADGFAAFTEAGDPFDPGLAAGLKTIYSAGDTADPMTLYRAFRGRDPAIAALLEQRGLDA